MIHQSILWIDTSIYYNCNKWNKLITECINPIINKIISEHNEAIYIFGLDFSRGDCIQFSIHINNNQNIILYIHETLNNFLVDNPSLNKKQKLSESLFLNFPNNTVHYNLFSRYIHDSLHLTLLLDISSILITFIKEKGEIEKKISHFFFFINLLIFRSAFQEINHFKKTFDDLNGIFNHITNNTNKIIYTDYIDLVSSTFKRIWIYKDLSAREYQFINNCKLMLQKNDFLSTLNSINHIIYGQLNLNKVRIKTDNILLINHLYQFFKKEEI